MVCCVRMTGCADAPLRSRRAGNQISLIILLALPACVPAFAVTLVYTERSDPRQSDERAVTHTFIIDPAPGGYAISVTSQQQGGLVVYQKLRTNEGFSVLEWWYLDEAKATEFTAIREGSVIRFAGRRGTRSVSRTFAVDDSPWYQLFPHGLEQLVASGGQGLRFWAVGAEGAGAMRIGAFRAIVGKLEQIEYGGALVEARHVRIRLAGPGSLLWSGDYWHRPHDGRNLVSSSDRGPGSHPIRIELSSER